MADLGDDDTPDAFRAHPNLRPKTVEMLRLQHLVYLYPNDSRWSAKLAHLNPSVAAGTLARLSASAVAARIATELNRRKLKPKKLKTEDREYLRPTVWAGLWRDPHDLRELQRMVRDHPQRQDILAGLHMWADDERGMRAIQLAMLLIEQAELAALPLRPQGLDGLIDKERQRAEYFRLAGSDVQAKLCEWKAARLGSDHERDFRSEKEARECDDPRRRQAAYVAF